MELPARARAWIVAVWVAALILVAIHVPDLSSWKAEDVAAWFALSAIAAILEQFTVRMSHGPEAENYSLTDGLWVPTLIFARSSVLTLAVLVGIAAGQLIRGWRWYKVAYNVAQFVIAITVAEVVFSFFHVSSTLSLMVWLAASIAMLAYFGLNELFISFVISLIDGESLPTLLVLPDGLNLLHAAGNLTIGLLAALVWSTGPVGIPLLIAPMVLVFLAYRGWLHAQREEEQEKERERMRTLYEAGRELSGPIDAGYDYKPFLMLVRRMLDASGVELVLLNDGARIYNSEVGLMVNLPSEDHPPSAEELVSTRPGLTTFMASVGDAPTVSAILAVHRVIPLSSAEGSLVEALASQLKVRNENERLFNETMEQRSHLSDVIGNTSDGILVVSADGLVVSWNPAMEHITGIPRTMATGRPCDEVLGLHLEDDGPEERVFVPLRFDEAGSHDVLLTRTDGSDRWIRYTSNPMPSREGGARSFVIVARDVTAELETEQLKSDFVATVSHELRSPLTPLKGFVRALRDGLIEETPEARHEYYEIMWRAVERLERLINDLLDVSRVEAGKLDLESKPFNVTELLDGCIRHIRSEFPDRVVDFVHPDDAICVLADPFRVDQIVTNLLSNAFKYSTAGSTVQLSLRVDEDRAVIAVHNVGEGIAPADQPYVFDRFFRTRTDVQREVGGAGLGLFICRRLVEAMGSQIELESIPGEGCTFTFWLPEVTADMDGARDARRPIETLT